MSAMESYLKGRQKAQKFHVAIPASKDSAAAALKAAKHQIAEEEVVHAEPVDEAAAPDAPEVDLVMKEGVVQRIIVHLPNGQRLELECVYDEPEAE
jgi:hypothetical protein